MQTSEQINEIAAAMAAVQGEMRPALKDATNPHFRSKYADLSSVFEAIRGPLAKNGLTVWQDLGNDERGVTVRTRIIHKSGQWVEFGPLAIPAGKQDAQGLGSAATYARRYGLSAALGVVADLDDDGNAAAQPPQTHVERAAQRMASGNGVDKQKNPAGRSAVITDVREHCREINACADADQLIAYINDPDFKAFALMVCKDYPSDWLGPEDNSGLSGAVAQMGVTLKCADVTHSWISKAEAKARATTQQAAQ